MEFVVMPDQKESKFEQFKRKVALGARKTVRWIDDNKVFVCVVAIPTAIALGSKIELSVRRHHLNQEQTRKMLSVYDPSLRKYWTLKRKPSNNELKMIENRRSNGEKLSQILEDLNLLK